MKILAIDPGLCSGICCLEQHQGILTVTALGVLQYGPELGSDIMALFRTHNPTLVVFEDWVNMGSQPDISSSWPNRVIGAVESCASLLGVHTITADPRRWKKQFTNNADYLPQPPWTGPEKFMVIAQRAQHELSLAGQGWPGELLEAIPKDKQRHAVDALGLALWAVLSLKTGTPRMESKT